MRNEQRDTEKAIKAQLAKLGTYELEDKLRTEKSRAARLGELQLTQRKRGESNNTTSYHLNRANMISALCEKALNSRL